MKHFLFYGTLRQKGHKDKTYNFNRFGGQKFVKIVEVEGWDMFSLGYYPCITPGKGKVTFELHEVSDEAAKSIERMEQGAGYDSQVIDIEGTPATIYYWDRENIMKSNKQIASGNWCE